MNRKPNEKEMSAALRVATPVLESILNLLDVDSDRGCLERLHSMGKALRAPGPPKIIPEGGGRFHTEPAPPTAKNLLETADDLALLLSILRGIPGNQTRPKGCPRCEDLHFGQDCRGMRTCTGCGYQWGGLTSPEDLPSGPCEEDLDERGGE